MEPPKCPAVDPKTGNQCTNCPNHQEGLGHGPIFYTPHQDAYGNEWPNERQTRKSNSKRR